jgi:hypothetical protein
MAASILPEPIYWTWNFILTMILTFIILPVIATMIVNAIKRQFAERDKKDEEIKTLLTDREAEKEKHIKERWDSFTRTQCDIKKNLDTIGKAMVAKLDKVDHEETCEKHMDIIWERLDHHCHDVSGNVVIPSASKR